MDCWNKRLRSLKQFYKSKYKDFYEEKTIVPSV